MAEETCVAADLLQLHFASMTSSNRLLRAKLALVAILSCLLSVRTQIAAESNSITGNAAATSDWTQDAPGVRHKVTIDDLPAPYATKSAQNDARVVRRPPDAQLRVPPGFKVEEYARGFDYPRFLLTAPNGDIFVTESRSNSIKVLRDKDGDGKPDILLVDKKQVAWFSPSAT